MIIASAGHAFLHNFIDEELYMSPPKGYFKATPRQVCKLQKSIYSFKQAGRQWNKELTAKLKEYGFTQSFHDHCSFIKRSGLDF